MAAFFLGIAGTLWALPARATQGNGSADVNCDTCIEGNDSTLVVNPFNVQQLNPTHPRVGANAHGYAADLDIAEDVRQHRCLGNLAPVADAGSDVSAVVGVPVLFDGANSLDPDGAIAEFVWDFNDGNEVSAVQSEHAFAAAGLYAVTLAVVDDCNAVDSETIVVTVTEDEPGPSEITADFAIDPSVGEVHVPMTFAATAPPAQVMMYLWNFSDGGGAYGQAVTHAFEYAGAYSATLTVITNEGVVLTNTRDFSVSPGLRFLKVMTDNSFGEPRGIALVGNTVWAAGEPAVATADVTDPANPVLLGSVQLSGIPWSVDARDDLVAVAALSGGVYFFDAQQPVSFAQLGRFKTGMIDGSYAYDAKLIGDYAYVSCQSDLKIVDIANPASPILVASLPGVRAAHVRMVKSRAYVRDAVLGGYRIFNVSNPHSPVQTGTFLTAGNAVDVSCDGDILAIAESTGIEIFDIANADSPVRLSVMSFAGGGVYGVAIRGDFLYVSHGGRVTKLDIGDPSAPSVFDWVQTNRQMFYLRRDAEFLYSAVVGGVTATLAP